MPYPVTVLTMFPEAFPGPLGVSLIGTAWRERGLWSLETVDIRAFSDDRRGFLDDTPAGGGPGAVLKADVVARALDSLDGPKRPLLYMSARGRPLTQARVKDWATADGLVVLCGRFEGVDQRVLDARRFEEVAVGDALKLVGTIKASATPSTSAIGDLITVIAEGLAPTPGSDTVTVLFDDWVSRDAYREVTRWVESVEIVGRMARFEIAPRAIDGADLSPVLELFARRQ